MSEQALDNLEYGFNLHTENWHVYQNGDDTLAMVTSEKYAALFAAAPDLLEALREVVRVVFDGDWTTEAQPALEQAKEAIAKVKET